MDGCSRERAGAGSEWRLFFSLIWVQLLLFSSFFISLVTIFYSRYMFYPPQVCSLACMLCACVCFFTLFEVESSPVQPSPVVTYMFMRPCFCLLNKRLDMGKGEGGGRL